MPEPEPEPALTDADRETIAAYRKGLCESRDVAQDSYDKAILTVAGGGLAVTLGFVKPGAHPVCPLFLLAASGLFAFSLLSVIYSFHTSGRCFDETVRQVDSHLQAGRIFRETPGGADAERTKRWNRTALRTLALGIVSLAVFVTLNLGRP